MGEQFSSPDPVNGSVLLCTEFTGVEDAYASYMAYTKGIGFAIQKGDSVKDEEKNIVRKFFYCNRQGLRKKKHYERVDRKIPINWRREQIEMPNIYGKWWMKALVEEHNHDLASPVFTNVMAPHRKITEGHKAHLHSMHEAGFQTTQIMDFFAHMCGGYRHIAILTS
ncbi:hypothetical protein Ahy_A08g037505 isoform A [Arachis hypogaea]|uniref:FAR1 domain-containing protein n=1 Tax=Arachis hypogaea TaxID=3818 RepID=A0A445BR58_ARAHY|nr:hypothetical protein Ahy_A08g037505 isoform A [Arachis hypogaea]